MSPRFLACTTEWTPIPPPNEGTPKKERVCFSVFVRTVFSAYKAFQPLANSFFKLLLQRNVPGSSGTSPIPVLKSAILPRSPRFLSVNSGT